MTRPSRVVHNSAPQSRRKAVRICKLRFAGPDANGPAVSRPNSTSILTVQCNGAVVRSSGYTNPIYFPRRTAVLYRRNSAVYF
jgi:hypothetical protein